MPDYFESPDGHGEPTIWVRNPGRPDHPVAIIRSHDVHTHYWPDVVARMTGTTAQQFETATVQLKTMSGVVDRLRADMRTWQRAAAERTRERDEATDQLEATIRARDAYRADRDELSELLAKANDSTTVTTDDATVDVVARALYAHQSGLKAWGGAEAWEQVGDVSKRPYRNRAEAVLAALTGVPHD